MKSKGNRRNSEESRKNGASIKRDRDENGRKRKGGGRNGEKSWMIVDLLYCTVQ
jgi:hypothetical protein